MSDTPPEEENKQEDPSAEADALGLDETIKDEQVEEIRQEAEEKEKSLEEMTEEELLAKVLEYRALSQRLAADYQNLKKDGEDRVVQMRKYGNADLLMEIAPLVDYFNSAFAAVPEEEKDSPWMTGIQYIQQHLRKVLTDHNVEIIEKTGEEFNEELHEAVSEEASTGLVQDGSGIKSNIVLRVSQVGFKLNGRVVKHAKVVVSK